MAATHKSIPFITSAFLLSATITGQATTPDTIHPSPAPMIESLYKGLTYQGEVDCNQDSNNITAKFEICHPSEYILGNIDCSIYNLSKMSIEAEIELVEHDGQKRTDTPTHDLKELRRAQQDINTCRSQGTPGIPMF